jgi:hypothetical protein
VFAEVKNRCLDVFLIEAGALQDKNRQNKTRLSHRGFFIFTSVGDAGRTNLPPNVDGHRNKEFDVGF